MFDDTGGWSDGETVEADICIVGGGPAGIAIALAFVGTPIRVVLLEAGGWRPTRRGQDFLWAETAGAPNHSFAFSRFRAFGGAGTRWAGLCPVLDKLDFEPLGSRPGWPIDRRMLEPWWQRAAALFDLPEVGDDLERWERRIGPAPRLGAGLRPVVLPVASKRDLGAAFRDTLRHAPNVRIVLGADALAVETNDTARRAEAVRIALPSGRRARCVARHVVLAAGGVENARLLLLSDDRAPAGLGNGCDQVGRWFMDHAYFFAGHFEPATPEAGRGPHIVERFERLASDPGALVAFTLSEEIRRREGLTGAAGFFMRRETFQLHPDYAAPGGAAVTYFAEIARGERFWDRAAPSRLADLFRQLPAAARTVARYGAERIRPRTRLALRLQIECTPHADSRVTLAETSDALGRRRAHVEWRIHDDDVRGAARLWSALAAALPAGGLGRLKGDEPGSDGRWPASMTGGKHHMGTTRMADDPRLGVVDRDCRVHGMENLHIAGASVFPSGGWANPTLTAVALALRLADKLEERLKSA